MTLTVASSNIRHGLGMDGRVDLERAARVIARMNPDVAALQEVDRHTERSGRVDQAMTLGRLLHMHHAYSPFMPFQGGEYGLAMLFKQPPLSQSAIRLPDGNEPRSGLRAEVQLEAGQRAAIYCVHLDWVDDDSFRFAQAEVLAAQLGREQLPFVLLGDLNDVPQSRTVELLGSRADSMGPGDTFPSGHPVKQIDYILAGPKGAWRTERFWVADEPEASDHRPIAAVLRLP